VVLALPRSKQHHAECGIMMKRTFFLFILAFLVSCASKPASKPEYRPKFAVAQLVHQNRTFLFCEDSKECPTRTRKVIVQQQQSLRTRTSGFPLKEEDHAKSK